jgi:hypothetical protein
LRWVKAGMEGASRRAIRAAGIKIRCGSPVGRSARSTKRRAAPKDGPESEIGRKRQLTSRGRIRPSGGSMGVADWIGGFTPT